MSKLISLHDAPPKLRNHVFQRLADITKDYLVHIEDLCKLNNLDYAEVLCEMSLTAPKLLKTEMIMELAKKNNVSPEAAIFVALEQAGINFEEFLDFIKEERSKDGS